jgi:hypothetical protein
MKDMKGTNDPIGKLAELPLHARHALHGYSSNTMKTMKDQSMKLPQTIH